MPKQITFTDVQEAREYSSRKEREGYPTEVCCPQKGTYVVKVGKYVGKRKEGRGIKLLPPKATPSQLYKEAKGRKLIPYKSRKRIREIAEEELKQAGKDVPITITEEMGMRYGSTAIGYDIGKTGKPLKGSEILLIHPIHEYETVGTTRAGIRHEIGHLRELEHERLD